MKLFGRMAGLLALGLVVLGVGGVAGSPTWATPLDVPGAVPNPGPPPAPGNPDPGNPGTPNPKPPTPPPLDPGTRRPGGTGGSGSPSGTPGGSGGMRGDGIH